MPKRLHALRESIVVWPVTAVYAFGILSTVLTTQGVVTLAAGIALFGCASILVVLASVLHELHKVSSTVNVQHDTLLLRVEQLDLALREAGLRVPEYPVPELIVRVPPKQRSAIRSRRNTEGSPS